VYSKLEYQTKPRSLSKILRKILKGLDYLHGEKKVHRDIKAANILFSETGDIQRDDFGVASQLTQTANKCLTFVWKPFWMAPKVIRRDAYDTKADIWSLGITATELATGQAPHSELDTMRVLFTIPKNPAAKLTENFSRQFEDSVELCLN
jgi:serine/threonine-protein kinase 24/25/MST4